MNHITALAIARTIQQDRLDAAQHRRTHRDRTVTRAAAGRPHVFQRMARALFSGYRRQPAPSR